MDHKTDILEIIKSFKNTREKMQMQMPRLFFLNGKDNFNGSSVYDLFDYNRSNVGYLPDTFYSEYYKKYFKYKNKYLNLKKIFTFE